MNKTLHSLHSTFDRQGGSHTIKNLQLFIHFSADKISLGSYWAGEKQFKGLSTYTRLQNSLPELNDLHELRNSMGVSPKAQVGLVFSSIKHVLIPKSLFDETHKDSYLNIVNEVSQGESVLSWDIPKLDSVLVCSVENDLMKLGKQAFPNASIHHHLLVMLQKVLDTPHEKGHKLWIYFRKKSFDLVLQHKNKILLLNSFTFETKEDVAYHVLNLYQQFNLDNAVVPACLCGEIMKESAVYELLYRYIANIDIWEGDVEILNGLDFMEMPSAYYFTLINLPKCV